MLPEHIRNFLSSTGTAVTGSCENEAAGIALAQKFCLGKPYCSVREWMLVDLETTETIRASAVEDGVQPILLYAHCVVTDSALRFEPGDWVRTSLLVELKGGCLFETKNTAYILLGDGVRNKLHPAVVATIFGYRGPYDNAP